MRFTFAPLSAADISLLQTWRYEGPYAVYSMIEATSEELLDSRSPYFAAHNEQRELVGFFCFGTSAEVTGAAKPTLWSENHSLTIGLGLRPDLTGQGLGLAFVEAGLDFARQQFAPTSFRLFVLAWNERAMQVYARAGFERVRALHTSNIYYGENDFIEMQRPA